MEPVEWNSSFLIGFQEVDDDHQVLVRMFNTLVTNVSKGTSHEIIGQILNELVSYTAWHFRHEERLMQTYRYPGFMAHKKEHNDLVEQTVELQTKFHAGQQTINEQVINFLKEWLVHHILGTDKEMADFLMKKQ
ncbi:MAG: hemerythrin family protein [Magnetococcales bacterium]|nr:hemerythrin family protein [Magnetococcales bacterium]